MSFKNMIFPALVLIIVMFIWFYQNLLREHRTELPVEVRFTELPQDYLVTLIEPEEISVTVEGRGIDIFRFNRTDYYLKVEIPDLQFGRRELIVTDQNLILEDPHYHGQLNFYLNKTIEIEIDRTLMAQIPVTIRYMTTEDEIFFEQRNAMIEPDHVEIIGPRNTVLNLTEVRTVPISSEEVTDHQLQVELEIPEGILGIKPDIVTITLESPAIISRTIPMINIEFPAERVTMIIPQSVTVKIEGLAERLQRLRPREITAYIIVPEEYEYDFAPININIPDDIKLIEYTPERVQIFRHE